MPFRSIRTDGGCCFGTEGGRAVGKTPLCRGHAAEHRRHQAGLGYEVVFDTSPAAPGVEELRALAQELARRVGLR